MKSGEMKHEMILFHTMGHNRNFLLQTHLLFVRIYGLMWSSFNIRLHWTFVLHTIIPMFVEKNTGRKCP